MRGLHNSRPERRSRGPTVPDQLTQPYALSETPLDELAALDPGAITPPDLLPIRDAQGRVIEENEKPRRRQIYGMAHARGLSALSLSGGGIRSAAFALGIISGAGRERPAPAIQLFVDGFGRPLHRLVVVGLAALHQ